MVVLDPERVELGGDVLAGVRSISVDRAASRLVEEWGDGGPFCVFVDAPEIRVTVNIVRLVAGGEVGAPVGPGEESTLSFVMAPNASGAKGQRVRVDGVVASVKHEAPTSEAVRSAALGVVQTIALRAVGGAVDQDPVVFVADEGV